jgi:7-cyano-7-deazaguanine synthase in queuosine biosynthesis
MNNFEIPNWWQWKLNNQLFQSLKSVFDSGNVPTDFEIIPTKFTSFDRVGSFREEMYATATQLIARAKGKTILIATSGIDSESLVRLIVEAGGNVEMIYVKKTFKDDIEIEILNKISTELDVRLHIKEFKWHTDSAKIKESILITCTQATMMNHMYWAFADFDNSKYFYVTGNGAFRKVGNRFKVINKKYNIAELSKKHGRMIPMDLRDICMRNLASTTNMDGEFYAHIYNISEVAALFKNKNMKVHDSGEIDDKDVYFTEFPDCLFKHKTDPYYGNYNHAPRFLTYLNSLLESKYGTIYTKTDTRHIAGFINVDEVFL